ncbi:hypothetical protein DC366_09000 [Pelagivirga sediminicola]|uniref:DUF1127 domain-containing protein n=2 Tax=Pelagivirga sediminicola TaxID=2170575 RepID=A0A2T7G7F7_9RHOB|nr:hypothetical protein DC366_09000 [Pelagivirga sediminicola]
MYRSAAPSVRDWMRNAIRNWRRRKMIATFEAMDDNLLGEIGIERAEIPRVVESLDMRELRMRPLAPQAPRRSADYDDFRQAA